MNETAPPPPPAPTEEGPRVTGPEMRDVGRLRRVHQGRSLAGVCGGLGRHFDLDPTIFKVAFVVLVFFGGAGLFLYAALWLLVPDERTGRAVLDFGQDAGKVLILVAVGVAAVLVLGNGLHSGWGGWWFGSSLPFGILALAAIGVVAYLVTRDRRPTPTPTPTPTGQQPVHGPPPPPAPAYVPPPRPRRSGPVLFWPTLALVALALGLLGVYDAGHAVSSSAYWALALAVVGVMLVIGAVRGRPGGLVLLGIVAALGLGASSTVGTVHRAERLTYDPTTASDVRSTYRMGTGELSLNLSDLSDASSLAGRTIHVSGRTGSLLVIVPQDLTVNVDAHVKYAGGIDVGGQSQGGGLDAAADTTLAGPAGAPSFTLDADLKVGQIQVRHPDE